MGNEVRFPRRGEAYSPLPDEKKDGHARAHAVQTINADPMTIYSLWRREEVLPLWMEGVVSVTRTSESTSHWVMQVPGTEKQMEFDAEIVQDEPGRRLVSRVKNGPTAGTTDDVTFSAHPSGRGMVVTLVSDFVVPGGILGNAVAAVVSRSPRQITIENVRHLKELVESGEIPRVTGQPAGPRGLMGKWKEFILGETNPTPPGTSETEQPQDLPRRNSAA
jgi:uncharacterized membrane protein